jgi:hypothetical protein
VQFGGFVGHFLSEIGLFADVLFFGWLVELLFACKDYRGIAESAWPS